MFLQQTTPEAADPLQVSANGRFVAQGERTNLRQVRLDVHRAGAAQTRKTAVHFSADAAGTRTGSTVLRPELFARELLGHVFGNGQGVPHGQTVVHQHGHFAHRVDVFERGLEVGVGREAVKADIDLFKVDARLAQQHPGAHGPRRIVFVGDVELDHCFFP